MQMKPLLSVVTVTFRDTEGLRRTLASLEPLAKDAGANIEVLVVDGGSGSEINGIASDFPWAQIRSEPDAGIYDAMNKGLERSCGSFVWFLNGGDECSLVSWEAVASLLRRWPGTLLLAAYFLRIGTHSIHRSPRPAAYIWHGLPTSHQAIFYPGAEARRIRYDERFPMVGDYHFTARLLRDGVPVELIDVAVSRFNMDGISFQESRRVALEANRVQRETLESPGYLRQVSRLRHGISRNLRRLQAHAWR